MLPNGYTEGPRKFTKLMKQPLAKLRNEKVSIADYIDDCITMTKSFDQCLLNIDRIVTLLDELGFVIHPESLYLS